jgi:serine/threonine protein kinase
VAPAIDSSVGGAFAALRVGNATVRARHALVDAATEWLLRGREALLPSFAQLLRARGAPVPSTMAELVGLGVGANVTDLVERAQQALRSGAPYDERPLIARTLEQLYPRGVEQIDALVGLMVEPPEAPLSSSVGPTLGRCVHEQLERTRAGDRLWHEGSVDHVSLGDLLPRATVGNETTSSSLLRRLLVLNYEFEDKAAGSVRALGTLTVPAGLEAARDAVTRFVRSESAFTGGGARAVRLGFHTGGTYESASMRYGFAHGDCVVRQLGQADPANRGLERVPLEVSQLRNSADGALFLNMSNADLIALIGAVGATTASRGGMSMVWRRGRVDVPSSAQEQSVCPMHGNLPDALLGGDNSYPHTRTLEAIRVKFQRQGFNDRELVALLGAHSLGGLHESLSGFPNGLWTLKRDVCDNTYFRNLLPFASPLNRAVVRAATGDKFAYRLVAGSHTGEVGVTMLPSDVAFLGNAVTRDWVERYAADNALFQRDFAHVFQRMLENGAAGVGTPLAPLPETLTGGDGEMGGNHEPVAVDEQALERDSDAPGAPPQLPFFALRSLQSATFLFKSAPPVAAGARPWQSTTQPLPSLRVSFVTDRDDIHVLLETPADSYVGLGFGPRVAGASMRGADVMIVALKPDGTPVVRDSFAQLDQLQPTLDVMLNGTDDAWFDVRAERVDGISRYWMSRARIATDEWDNDVPHVGSVETLFALGSVSLRDGEADDVLATYHGSQRVVVRMEWPVPPDAPGAVTQPRVIGPAEEELPILGIVLGAVGGALLLLIGVVLCAVYFVRRANAREAASNVKVLNDDEHLVDGERVAVPAHLKQCEMADAAFALALLNPSAGLFRDPVPAREYDEDLLFKRRAAQQAQQVPVRGIRLLAVEKVYCDILLLQNVSGEWQDVALYLPPIAPQFHVAIEPQQFRLAPDDVQAVKVSVLLTCTTKQRITIKAGVGKFVADLPTAKVEAELSTLLDFDEIHLIERIGEGSYGVVFAGSWRKQAVAVKMLRQQQFGETDQADLRAEAKLLTQLLHRNIVQFRGAVFRESQCCLVTELAPHGSLKSVLARFGLPWDLVIKLCVDMASGVQFLHTSGIIHRDIKSDNVLVFSLSPRESVCAKLTDFGSARAGKAHVDATGRVELGADKQLSANEGTPIYMSPQLFARSSRPSEASDCYALGVLFYEVASEREPWADVPFAWNVAKLVMAGQRPTWPEHVVESAPAPFVPLVGEMWAQRAEARPQLDDVLQRLADCQEAIGDAEAATETRRNLQRAADGDAGDERGDVLDKRVVLALVNASNSAPESGTNMSSPLSATITATTVSSGSGSVRLSDSPQPNKSGSGNADYARALGLVRRLSNVGKMSVGDSSDGESSPLRQLVAKKPVEDKAATESAADAMAMLMKRRTGGIVQKNKSSTFGLLQPPATLSDTTKTTTTTTTSTTTGTGTTTSKTATGMMEALVISGQPTTAGAPASGALAGESPKKKSKKKKVVKTTQVVEKRPKEKL